MDINSSTELATAVTSNVAIRTAAQLEIFGPPPLLEGESQQAYDTLLAATRRRRYLRLGARRHRQQQCARHQPVERLRVRGRDLRYGSAEPHRNRHHHTLRQQHLYRRHHGQRRHVAGERLDSSRRVIVNGGTLGGTGTLGPVTVNGGTLAPGNSIGTITVAGNLTFNSASTYQVEVSPTSADRTNVTGTASLAGTVQAIPLAGSFRSQTYTILNATGGVTARSAVSPSTVRSRRARAIRI